MLPRKWTTAALVLAACAGNSAAAPAGKPNLIVILADDLGCADVGFNGCKDIPTPNIDSIAENGVRCTSGYVTHPFCSPTRAGLMTGRYQQRFGHENNPVYDPEDTRSGLPTSEVLLPAVLKGAGYVSGIVGKWHLGAAERFHPLSRGFDEFFGFLGGGHQYFPDKLGGKAEYTTDLMRGRDYVKESEYLTDAFAREAEAFVERHRDRPFFLYLAFNAPHTPLQATPKYLDRFAGIADEKRRTYAAMLSAVDDGVGRVLAALREHRIEERTLVVFLSDNGGPVGINGSSNLPLRAGKGTTYEGGVRVPFAVQWAGTLPAGSVYDRPVSSLDVFATAVALAGASPPSGHTPDGVDLVPYLRGEKAGAPHEALFWRTGGGASFGARAGVLKLVEPRAGQVELYDLSRDVGESNDLASAQPEAARRLARLKDEWNAQLVAPIFQGPPPNARAKAAAAKKAGGR
jgi:arylsulfatase A-like enzyme